MGKVRVLNLLSRGNAKVGDGVHLWGIPAGETCPGKTPACERVCYAKHGRYRFASVRERLASNLLRSRCADFAGLMAAEVRRRGCLVVRVHSSGDFYDAEYAEKWLWVMRKRPQARYYFYTRSWRVPEVAGVIARMAALPCVRAWYSVDGDAPAPEEVPPGVRVAHLRVDAAERVEGADLVFRVRGLRSGRVGLGLVCPSETPAGRAKEVTCGGCQRCWK